MWLVHIGEIVVTELKNKFLIEPGFCIKIEEKEARNKINTFQATNYMISFLKP
ncbi:hypothetical protein ES705_42687 [subsurface metagenome]